MTSPEKVIKAASHGARVLYTRILPLREQLHKLESAHTTLANMKLNAERKIIEVQIIPIGMTKQKAKQEALNLEKQIKGMTAEEATELLAMLEKRLEGKE